LTFETVKKILIKKEFYRIKQKVHKTKAVENLKAWRSYSALDRNAVPSQKTAAK